VSARRSGTGKTISWIVDQERNQFKPPSGQRQPLKARRMCRIDERKVNPEKSVLQGDRCISQRERLLESPRIVSDKLNHSGASGEGLVNARTQVVLGFRTYPRKSQTCLNATLR
jgi:hypothetical protein